jgi:hypothetical protein
MQPLSHDIIALIASEIHADSSPWTISRDYRTKITALCNLSLANRAMAKASEPYRFHTIVLNSDEQRLQDVIGLLHRNSGLLSHTQRLILDCSSGVLEEPDLEWMTMSQTLQVFAELNSVQSLTLWNVFMGSKPPGATSLDVFRMFPHVRDLQIDVMMLSAIPHSIRTILNPFPELNTLECKLLVIPVDTPIHVPVIGKVHD